MDRSVYIAYDHYGQVLSAVAAPRQMMAEAYWQGAGLIPHKVEAVYLEDDEAAPVIPLVSTRKLTISDADAVRDPMRRDRFRLVVP